MFKIKRGISSSSEVLSRMFLVCPALLLLFTCFWLPNNKLPLPGIASGVIALTAAALSFYNEIKPWQKSVAIIVLCSFLVVELRAIKNDRTKTDAKALADKTEANRIAAEDKTQQDKRFAALLDAQQQDFLQTEERIRRLIRNDQMHFESTIGSVNGVLKATKEVAGTSQRSLDAAMGTDSVPCVTPDDIQPRNGKILLAIAVLGKNSLSGVNVDIYGYESMRSVRIFTERVGTVSPGVPVTLSQELNPVYDNHHMVNYNIRVSTQNGQYEEMFEILQTNGPNYYQWKASRLDRYGTASNSLVSPHLLGTCRHTDPRF